jgi:hypothetical protein
MHEGLPETAEEGKRKPTDENGKSRRVEKKWNAQVLYLPTGIQATCRARTHCDGRVS